MTAAARVACAWCLASGHSLEHCPNAPMPFALEYDESVDTAHVPEPLHEGLLNAGRREGWLKCWMDIAPTGLVRSELEARRRQGQAMALLAFPE